MKLQQNAGYCTRRNSVGHKKTHRGNRFSRSNPLRARKRVQEKGNPWAVHLPTTAARAVKRKETEQEVQFRYCGDLGNRISRSEALLCPPKRSLYGAAKRRLSNQTSSSSVFSRHPAPTPGRRFCGTTVVQPVRRSGRCRSADG